MDLQNIHAFVTVARCGSFSGAAEQLFITQPAVSKRIAALENQFGHRLFDRLGHKIILTSRGEALMPHAQAMLNALEDGQRAVGQLSDTVSGTLKVVASHHVGLHYLPPILKQYIGDYPDVSLNLEFVDSEQAWQEIVEGTRELAIVTLPNHRIEHLETLEIWQDPLSPMLAVDHPVEIDEAVSLDRLADIPAILPAHGTMTRLIIDQALKNRPQLTSRAELSTHYLETIKMMVSVGLGWSILPETMLDHSVRAFQIKGMKKAVRRIGIAWHPQRTLSNPAQSLIEVIQRMK